jgi:hypothetical protein
MKAITEGGGMGALTRRAWSPAAAAAMALALAACGGDGFGDDGGGVIVCGVDDGMKPSDFGEANFSADVHFVGERGALWSNGSIVDTCLDAAVSVFASDGDVYVAGRRGGQAVVWKNGSIDAISGEDGDRTDASIRSIFVSGGDVYAAGTKLGPQSTTAVLWVNGRATSLAEGGADPYGRPGVAEANSVAVSDGVVYVAGEDKGEAVLWVDGEARRLGEGRADSVCVSGGDVYVAGKLGHSPTLWKNGKARTLGYSPSGQFAYPYNSAASVSASGGDAYVAGHAEHYAVLWTNGGAAAHLSNGKVHERAVAVAASGGSVYTVGSANVGMWIKSRLWLDGRPMDVPDLGPLVSVFVAERAAAD